MFVRMPHVIMDFHERILIMTGYETFLKNLGISFEWRIHKDIKKNWTVEIKWVLKYLR